MTIVDTINAVHARLVRNKRIWIAIVCGIALSYTALIVTLVGLIARPLGWVVGIGLLGAASYLGYRRRIFVPPTIEDGSSIIDRRFDTQDRALTLASTWDVAGEAEKAILARQLEALVPEFDVDAAFPITLETGVKRALATLPLVWGLIWYLGSSSSASNGSAERQAAIISELLDQRADIPLAVRESLIDLKDTLETKPLTDEAVIEALKAAQAEIDQANEALAGGAEDASDDTVEESDVAGGQSGSDIAAASPSGVAPVVAEPTPTPEPTPTVTTAAPEPKPQEEQPADKEKKKEQDSGSANDTDVQNSKSSDQQSGAENQPPQSKNDGGEVSSKSEQPQSGDRSGQSQGEQGKEDSEQGQEGDGDGNSSSKQGNKPGQGGGQSGSQGQSGQAGEQQGSGTGKSQQGGEKQNGAKGDRSGTTTSSGQSSGLEQAQQALDKVEQELNAAQQGEEKGDQQGEKGDNGESDSGKPGGAEGKEPGKSGQKSGAGQGKQGNQQHEQDKGKSKQDKQEQGGQSGAQGDQSGKPNDAARAESGAQGDTEPKEEFGEPPKLPVGSSLPKESDAALGQGDESGGLGAGLGDRKGFKDSEIKTGDEKYDSRFTGTDGKVGLNKGPARTKTNLEDVKLAKPDPVKDPAEQPIPLEYRDVLE